LSRRFWAKYFDLAFLACSNRCQLVALALAFIETSINLGGSGSGSLLDAAGLLGGLITAGQTPAASAPPATTR
jgi:hypothetical protein